MNADKAIECLIDADKWLIEGWAEERAIGSSDIFDHIGSFMHVDSTYNISIIGIFREIKLNKLLSTNDKWLALEGISSGLGEVACHLGFIDKYRVSCTVSNGE